MNCKSRGTQKAPHVGDNGLCLRDLFEYAGAIVSVELLIVERQAISRQSNVDSFRLMRYELGCLPPISLAHRIEFSSASPD
jgi:hypothetical protein